MSASDKTDHRLLLSTSLGQALENSVPLALVDFAREYLLESLSIDEIEAFETPTALPDIGRVPVGALTGLLAF